MASPGGGEHPLKVRLATTLRWASADLEVLHNDDKRYEIIDGELCVSR